MNYQHQQHVAPGTLVNVLSVCDVDDDELVRNYGVHAGWVVHGGGPAAMAVLRQVPVRPTGVVSGAVAAPHDDCATHNDVS